MNPRSIPFAEPHEAVRPTPVRRHRIGAFMRDACGLSEQQIEQILDYQRRNGMRFGEACVALRLAAAEDVLEALSRQFQYTTGFAGRHAQAELVAAADPFSDQADAFRELRSRLLLEVLDGQPRCALAVLSPDVGDGKTYLAANLAVACSQLGEATLLIDADLRTPRLHRLLQVRNGPGLSSVLAGYAEGDAAICPAPELPDLHFMPAGGLPPNPLELLQRPAFGALLEAALQRFHHVIVDSAAAVRGADPRVIAARCGAALVVARRGRSRMAPLEGLLDALSRGPATIAGVVMNEH